MKVLNGRVPTTKTRFLSVVAKKKTINQKLTEKAIGIVGVNVQGTNLDITVEKVNAYYHHLFQVEARFRMAELEFKPDRSTTAHGMQMKHT